MKVIIYIGLWTLEVKCTQYEICGEVAFKNARAMIFLKSSRAGNNFWSGSKILKKNYARQPNPDLTPLKVHGGV
jgi:hypothetical protein